MSGSSRDPLRSLEMLLPLDTPPPPPLAPKTASGQEGQEIPPPSPSASRRGRRLEPAGPPAPDPQTWADEALRRLQTRQGEVTESWRRDAELLVQQIGAQVTRLGETGSRTSEDLRETAEMLDGAVSTLTDALSAEMAALRSTVETQTGALRESVEEQGKTLAASTREAASHIGVARHELALSVAELKRRSFRHGIMIGGGTAVTVLLAARLLFPFWGMRRTDVEAWNRGMRLLETYRAAPPADQREVLRALKWPTMAGAPPDTVPSALSASPAAGR